MDIDGFRLALTTVIILKALTTTWLRFKIWVSSVLYNTQNFNKKYNKCIYQQGTRKTNKGQKVVFLWVNK